MDEVGERYTEVMVPADKANAANALKPIDERAAVRQVGDAVRRRAAPTPGRPGRNPHAGVADLFVATMKGTYA